MKTKFIFSLLTALLFNFATSGLFAQSIGIDHNLMFGIQMGLSLVPLQLTGCLADGLNKEIWIPEIIEKFYPETSFVSDSRDFSMWTDNEYLNLQEAGIDPRVFIDNEVYPIPVVARGDKPYKIPMKRFDTENTVHINAIEIEESAEKRRSVAAGHQKSLQMQFSELAIYNWAPKKDSETTPVIKINDGNASKQGTGYVAMTYEKVLALSTQLDMMLVPKEGRILALHPYHATDLQLQDLEMFKTFFSTGSMFGFKIHVTSMVPKYNGTTGEKVEWGAPVRDTDAIASTVWYRDAVCRAKSMEDMYYRLDRDLADFLTFVFAQVKDGSVTVVLTSDHGTSPAFDAGAEEADRFNPRQFEVIVNGFLNVRYGVGDWVVDYSDKCLWLNHNLIYERGLNLAEVQNEVAIFAMQFSGISHALAATAMRTSYFGSGYARRMQNSFYPRRSGDVILNLMPGWIEEQERCWSMSGSMYGYDTEVPLVFYGKGAGMQRVNRRVDMTAVAPTLARLAGIREPAASEGGVLEEIAE